jgi:hypothetical protein
MQYAISLAAIILAVLYFVYRDEIETFISRNKVCNETDGRCYSVVERFSESDKASLLLAELNIFCLNVLKHLRNKYLWNYSPNTEAKNIVKFLLSNYNPDGIIENAPTSSVNTSYVDDKGKVFGICLREKTSGKNEFHNIHDLQFVVLHEMSHMANVNFGHEEDFWEIFKFLLTEAKEAKLHEPADYSKANMNYCSLIVSHNPYFDDDIRVI